MRTSALLILILLVTSSVDSFAQGVRGEGGLSFTVGVPQGEFGDQLDNPGFGGSLYGGIGLGASPIVLGADVGFLIYGHERRTEPFSTTIPDVTVDVITNNNLVSGHLFARLQPPRGTFRPYADVLFGFKYLFTDTRIRSEGFNDDEPIARSTNFDDTALSYGAGGGIQIQVFDGQGGEGPQAVYIELGARYLIGRPAEYLKEGSVRRENGRVAFDVTKSDTDMLNVKLGVGVRF